MSAVSLERYLKRLGRGNVPSAQDPEPRSTGSRHLPVLCRHDWLLGSTNRALHREESSVQFPESLSA